MTPDIARVSAMIEQAAAEFIVPRFNSLSHGEIEEKAPGDLVTIADLETERALTPQLLASIPGSLVIGEEAAARNPGILAEIMADAGVWVIDPVDGTANFAAGIPLFAVMVAFIRGGEILASWIYDPITQVMVAAEAGAGAFQGNRRLGVAAATTPDRMSGTISVRFGNRALVGEIAQRSNKVGSVFSLRCAGQEYVNLAAGRTHFGMYHRLMPWDHAPGHLIHREAGGYGRRLNGDPYRPNVFDGGILLATCETAWHQLHDVLLAGRTTTD